MSNLNVCEKSNNLNLNKMVHIYFLARYCNEKVCRERANWLSEENGRPGCRKDTRRYYEPSRGISVSDEKISIR